MSSGSLVTDNHPEGWHAARCTDGNSGLAELCNDLKEQFLWVWLVVVGAFPCETVTLRLCLLTTTFPKLLKELELKCIQL